MHTVEYFSRNLFLFILVSCKEKCQEIHYDMLQAANVYCCYRMRLQSENNVRDYN